MIPLVLLGVLLVGGMAHGASHPTECGNMQKLKVKTEWAQAYQDSGHREEMNDDIWISIFKQQPEWRESYFSNVRGSNVLSPEFRAHAARISSAFDMAVNFLMWPELLDQHMLHLGGFHKDLGIQEDDFTVFRLAIIEAVHHRVGRCFDDDAWDLCSRLIIDGIQAHLA